VSLDSRGTATHHLTITYDFNSAKQPALRPYLGPDRYLDYLRVYTPPGSHLVSFDGFNGGMMQLNQSDQPGRQMWAGSLNIPDGTLYSLHFVWSVPHAATQDASGYWIYPVQEQHQPGSDQVLKLSVTMPNTSQAQQVYAGALDQDRSFVIHG
jgi:hypothetical protein